MTVLPSATQKICVVLFEALGRRSLEDFWFRVVRDFFFVVGWLDFFVLVWVFVAIVFVGFVGWLALGFFENKSIFKSISVKRKIPIPTLIFARKYLSFLLWILDTAHHILLA